MPKPKDKSHLELAKSPEGSKIDAQFEFDRALAPLSDLSRSYVTEYLLDQSHEKAIQRMVSASDDEGLRKVLVTFKQDIRVLKAIQTGLKLFGQFDDIETVLQEVLSRARQCAADGEHEIAVRYYKLTLDRLGKREDSDKPVNPKGPAQIAAPQPVGIQINIGRDKTDVQLEGGAKLHAPTKGIPRRADVSRKVCVSAKPKGKR